MHRRFQLWMGVFLLVYVILGLYTEFTLMKVKPLPDSLLEDFSYYERALADALSGENPYRILTIGPAYLYPPPALLVVEAFAAVKPFLLKAAVYAAFNIALVALMVYGVAKRYGYPANQVWYWYVLCLAFAPFLELLHIGQINVLTLFRLFVLFVFAESSSVLSSLGLAWAILSKVSPVLFLGYLASLRRWKSVAATIGITIALVGVSAVRYGWTPVAVYPSVFRWLADQFMLDNNSQALVAKIVWLERGLERHHVSVPALDLLATEYRLTQRIVTLYIASLILISIVLSMRGKQPKEPVFVVTGLGMMLAPNIMWYHHYVFMLLPLLIWMAWTRLDRRVVAWCLLGLLIAQVDRRHLTYGLLIHIFGHLSMLAVLYQQVKGLRCTRDPREKEDRSGAERTARTPEGERASNQKSARFHLILKSVLLATFAGVAIWYSIAIPAGEGVDEIPHFEYVRYVKEHGRLPVQPRTAGEDVQVWMGHHPPLYYLLGSLVIAGVDTSDSAAVFRSNPHFVWAENTGRNGWNVMLHFGQDRFPWRGSVLALHLLRLMTVGLGVVTLYSIYRGAQLLFPEWPWAPLGVAAIIGLNPSFLFMSSTVHHDTLQAMIFALAAWWALRFLEGPERRHELELGGLLLGAALLTKLSGLALVPVMIFTLALKSWLRREWKGLPQRVARLTAVAALVAGWWFARNQWLYGDPLGWRTFLSVHQHMVRAGPYTWHAFVHEFLGQIGRTFWGAFGYMHITFPEVTRPLWWLSGLAGVGLIVGLCPCCRGSAHWPKWSVVVSLLLLLFLSFVRFSIATVGAGHGRYLFPAGLSIGALLILGWNSLSGWRCHGLLSVGIAVGMLAYAIWLPYRFVLPKYAAPAEASAEELAQMKPLAIPLVEGVELIGYRTPDERLSPGQWLAVALYWRATGAPEMRRDARVRLEAFGEDDGLIARSDEFWPVPSMPPQVWRTDAVYVTHAALGLPDQTLPAEIELTIVPLVEGSEAGREIRAHLGELLTVGGAEEVRPEDVPREREEVFAGAIKLVGYRASPEVVRPGDPTAISLFWEVLDKPSADYTVFVHVLDAERHLVTQFDRPAGGPLMPASSWRAGQVLRDVYPLSFPRGTPPGEYVIRVGMYLWPSMEGLPISIDGEQLGDSFVDVGVIRVGE